MMRKLMLAGCLAMGLTFGLAGSNLAKADHGFGGYRGPACNQGFGRVGYGAGYAPYGRYYAAPVIAVPTFIPVAGYGRSSFYGGYGSAFNPGLGGFGNLGYPNPYGPRTLPRVQLRVGF